MTLRALFVFVSLTFAGSALAQSVTYPIASGYAFSVQNTPSAISATATGSNSTTISASYPLAQVTNPTNSTACVAWGPSGTAASWPCSPQFQIAPGQTGSFATVGAVRLAAILGTSGASGSLAVTQGYIAPISNSTPVGPSLPYEYTDLGACQLSVTSAHDLTGGTGVCNGGIPAGATTAVITVETQPIRWAGTGATNPPTTTFGNLQSVGTSFKYGPVADLSGFRMSDTAAGASTVDVEFFK